MGQNKTIATISILFKERKAQPPRSHVYFICKHTLTHTHTYIHTIRMFEKQIRESLFFSDSYFSPSPLFLSLSPCFFHILSLFLSPMYHIIQRNGEPNAKCIKREGVGINRAFYCLPLSPLSFN